MPLTANITNIARASLHDGPGIRTVVYFKGCGLRCSWCHNPETLTAENEILYAPIKCVHCGKCVEVCPAHHIIDGNDMVFLREGCQKCGRCAEACPSGALSVAGKQMEVANVMREIHKDVHYYTQSGGGVTLSGGECLLQADFCAELLEECKKEGIHTAIESALFIPWKNIEKVLPFCDFIFADFKIADAEKHRRFTSQDNRLILENLQKLALSVPNKVTVRIPLIPGVNDSPEDIAAFAEKLKPFANKLCGIEVLRYNTLAESKYIQIGKEYTDFGETQTDDYLLAFCDSLETALEHETKVYSVF